MKRLLWHSAAIGGPIFILAGCALPADVGREFRVRLKNSEGQPVQAVVDELGPTNPTEHEGRRVYAWQQLTIGSYVRDCSVEVTTDQSDRIVANQVTGSDYECGDFVLDLRRTANRYRLYPGLREREAEENRRMLDALVSLRRSFNRPDPERGASDKQARRQEIQ